MIKQMKVAAAVAALAGGMTASLAHANPVTVDFSVTSTQSYGPDYAVGTVGTGTFTFDEAVRPDGYTGVISSSNTAIQALDLAFNWFGVSFDESNAGIAMLIFTNGALTDWWIGGTYSEGGCGVYGCILGDGHAPDFSLLSTNNGGGSLNDGVHSGLGTADGSLTWSVRDASVPEPATLGLFGLGLTGLGWVRRKRGA